jgi:hypothetical protein
MPFATPSIMLLTGVDDFFHDLDMQRLVQHAPLHIQEAL